MLSSASSPLDIETGIVGRFGRGSVCSGIGVTLLKYSITIGGAFLYMRISPAAADRSERWKSHVARQGIGPAVIYA